MESTNNMSKRRGTSRRSPHKNVSPKVSAGLIELSVLQGAPGLEKKERMRLSYTPEEIGAMHDRNENFRGKQANIEKLQLYRAVKRDLVEFMERCDDVRVVDGFDPNIREKHALLWVDFSPAAILDIKEITALTAIMNKADGVIISAVGDHTRISFMIQNIWEK